jgi:hypothetical protein
MNDIGSKNLLYKKKERKINKKAYAPGKRDSSQKD